MSDTAHKVVKAMTDILNTLESQQEKDDAVEVMVMVGSRFMAKVHGREYVAGWLEAEIAVLRGEKHPALINESGVNH